MSDRMSEYLSDLMSEYMPGKASEYMSLGIAGRKVSTITIPVRSHLQQGSSWKSQWIEGCIHCRFHSHLVWRMEGTAVSVVRGDVNELCAKSPENPMPWADHICSRSFQTSYAHGSKRRIPRMANDLELHQPDDGPATWSCNIWGCLNKWSWPHKFHHLSCSTESCKPKSEPYHAHLSNRHKEMWDPT